MLRPWLRAGGQLCRMESSRGVVTLRPGVRRRHICDFFVKSVGRTVKICEPALDDEAPIQQLLNFGCVNDEASSKSIGVSYDDMLPFTAELAQRGVRSGLMTIAVDGDRLVAASAGCLAKRDPTKKPPPAEIRDYGPLIDSLAEKIPSRKARRVVAPAFDLEDIVWNFVPADVSQMMRVELSVVAQSYGSGGLLKHLVKEQAVLGVKKGLEYFDCQLTSARSTSYILHTIEKYGKGAKASFEIDYAKILDHKERVHTKVPLSEDVDRITLVYAPLRMLIETNGQICTIAPKAKI